jgi:hypothetical protein
VRPSSLAGRVFDGCHRAGYGIVRLLNYDSKENAPLWFKILFSSGDEAGNLRQVELTLPKGMRWGRRTAVYILLDLFPVYETMLGNVK